jgi:hypothetical protein
MGENRAEEVRREEGAAGWLVDGEDWPSPSLSLRITGAVMVSKRVAISEPTPQ